MLFGKKKFLAQSAQVRQRLSHMLQGDVKGASSYPRPNPTEVRVTFSQTTENQSYLQAFGQVPSLASCIGKAALLSVLQK